MFVLRPNLTAADDLISFATSVRFSENRAAAHDTKRKLN